MNPVPKVIFVQPRTVNAALAAQCGDRVVVLDVAFNAGSPAIKDKTPQEQYEETTLSLINALGDRLVLWIDHHPHKEWINFDGDERFILVPREKAPACPPLITSELATNRVWRCDTIIAHGDFDGVMSAAKLALNGAEPYPGADADSIAADSRVGTLSPTGHRYEEAMKANLADNSIRQAVFDELVSMCKIDAAQARYVAIQEETARLADQYEVIRDVAYVDATQSAPFDLTQLLLAGQKRTGVAVVRNVQRGNTQITIAGPKEWDFVKMFKLTGGMPNRVNLPDQDINQIIETINV